MDGFESFESGGDFEKRNECGSGFGFGFVLAGHWTFLSSGARFETSGYDTQLANQMAGFFGGLVLFFNNPDD